jgi:Leucine-rich repeat (LRR) protein
MPAVRAFDVSRNKLTGIIPPELFTSWPEVTTFHAQNNSIAGSIPPEIGNATKLQSVHLYTNSLSGHIPVEIGRLASGKPAGSQHAMEFSDRFPVPSGT